jgi:hypothetical protein
MKQNKKVEMIKAVGLLSIILAVSRPMANTVTI